MSEQEKNVSGFEIICVDDDLDILALYKEILSTLNYHVVEFSDPILAKEYILLHKDKIIFILADFLMTQEMDGLKLREEILSHTVHIPYAILTGHATREMALKGMELKIAAFLNKPVKKKEILDLVNKEIELRLASLNEDREIVMGFINESAPLLEEIEGLILQLEDTPDDEGILNTYFRLLHTIKGTSACVGLEDLGHFTHEYENLIGKLRSKECQFSPSIATALLKGLDVIKRTFSDVGCGGKGKINVAKEVKIFFDLDMHADGEVSKDEKSASPQPKEGGPDGAPSVTQKKDERIPVAIDVLDNFMGISGELTVLKNIIYKKIYDLNKRYPSDNELDFVMEAVSEMHKVSSNLQAQIEELRKVPLKNVFRVFKRVIRDTAVSLKKDIDFQVKGEELRVDHSVAQVFSNSLTHLIRNSIDHGVEPTEERIANGKKSQGLVEISVQEVGEDIILEVRDDGRGLNITKIKEIALKRGLHTEEELSQMREERIQMLIFAAGFSTAEKVTDISGRGVGMDMVKNSIEQINGKISLRSKVGEGTTFTFKIPIPKSVLIISSLSFKVGKTRFMIPLDDVKEVTRPKNHSGVAKKGEDEIDNGEQTILKIGTSFVYKHQDALYPLIDLNGILKNALTPIDIDRCEIIVVKTDHYCYGIMADEICDNEEVVVKKLSQGLQRIGPYLGAALVDDGTASLILSGEGLGKLAGVEIISDQDLAVAKKLGEHKLVKEKNENKKEYLIIEQQKQFYALELGQVYRLESLQDAQIQKSGHLTLVRYRDKAMPLISLNSAIKGSEDIGEINPEQKIVVFKRKDLFLGLLVEDILDVQWGEILASLNHKVKTWSLGTTEYQGHFVNVVNIDEIWKSLSANHQQLKNQQRSAA
jgi:two-component system, chemotaxis family, sensor kinase CheA